MRISGNVSIGHLRATLSDRFVDGESVARLRLSRLLNSVEFKPSALSPSTILIVRRLDDPLPGSISTAPDAPRLASAWEKSVQDALSQLCQKAARPSNGTATALAVRFTDEAELYAYLLWDLTRGVAHDHWWWRTFLRRLPAPCSQATTAVLLQEPRIVPAILWQLSRRSQAVPVVRMLAPQQAMRILGAVAHAHGETDLLASPAPIHARHESAVENSYPPDESLPDLSQPTVSGAERSDSDNAPPWPDEEFPASLNKEHRSLLGVGLTLYRQPAILRSPAFVNSWREWWKAESLTAASDAGPISAPAVHSAASQFAKRRTEGEAKSAGQPNRPMAGPAEASSGKSTRDSLAPDHSPQAASGQSFATTSDGHKGAITHPSHPVASHNLAKQDPREAQVRPETPSPANAKTEGNDAGENDDALVSATIQSSEIRDSESVTPEITPDWEGGVSTEFGGTFYLINLMCRLDLPSCFEERWRLASSVGAWGVLELLARGLLSLAIPDRLAAAEADAIWDALAQLSGRTAGEPLTTDCSPSAQFDLPSHWPVQMGDDDQMECFWGANPSRLRLWSATGYLLSESRRSSQAPSAQALAQHRRFFPRSTAAPLENRGFDQAPLTRPSGPLLAGVPTPLKRWLTFVLPYVRTWLERMLGKRDPEADRLRELLVHPAQLYLTPAHVDLVMRMDDISPSARRSGLDRDPGWLVDWGRVILFHFQ